MGPAAADSVKHRALFEMQSNIEGERQQHCADQERDAPTPLQERRFRGSEGDGSARNEPHAHAAGTHDQQGEDQRVLAADPIAVVAEQRRADRSGQERGRERAQGRDRGHQRAQVWKEHGGKDSAAAVP